MNKYIKMTNTWVSVPKKKKKKIHGLQLKDKGNLIRLIMTTSSVIKGVITSVHLGFGTITDSE